MQRSKVFWLPYRETLNQVKIRFYLLAWESGTSQVNWFSFPGVHSKAWLWLTKRQNTPPINSFRSIFSLQTWSWELSILKWNDLARVHPDLYSISWLRYGISSSWFLANLLHELFENLTASSQSCLFIYLKLPDSFFGGLYIFNCKQ